jgi:hypothetical protein
VFFVAWKSPKYFVVGQKHAAASIIPFKNYNPEHARPYIVNKPGLVVFGAEHTRDPNHPQIARLEQDWNRLQPTIALVEGRLGFLLPGLMDPVKELGEGGKVAQMAKKAGIPLYNWDLSKEELASGLQQHFSREQIALYQILNPYFSQVRFGKPAEETTFLEPYFKRAAFVGLQDSIKTIADIDRAWRKHFPAIDWRNVSDETTLPGYLDDMMAVTNDLRNQQLVAAVKELMAKGEKVFVVCGSSHAVCVAPAFK